MECKALSALATLSRWPQKINYEKQVNTRSYLREDAIFTNEKPEVLANMVKKTILYS